MANVSEGGVELFAQLVEWEMFDRKDVDPKSLLRGVSLGDLSIASKGLDARGGLGEFVTAQMVELEMLYRTGRIVDWVVERNGKNVRISVKSAGEKVKEFIKQAAMVAVWIIAASFITRTA